jgi:tRNA (cmo5U34)-methyltransferase
MKPFNKPRIPIPWVFNEEVAELFNEHVRQSVPFYDEIHRLITLLSIDCLPIGGTVCDIGTSTGEAIYNLHKYLGDRVFYVGIDPSPSMIKVAKQRLAHVKNVNFIEAQAQDTIIPLNNLCLCVLTLGFIKPQDRLCVLSQIYNSLKLGSSLILVEKVTTEKHNIQRFYNRCHDEFKLQNGLTLEQISAKKDSLKGILVPFSLEYNIRMLEQSGFRVNDIFFKWLNFAGIIAQKVR